MGGRRIDNKEDRKIRILFKERILVISIVVCLMATSMVGSILKLADASPVVQNPGFEIPGPAHWEFFSTIGFIVGVYPTYFPYTGDHSVGIRVDIPEPHEGEGYWSQKDITPIVGGTEYEVSCWIYTYDAEPELTAAIGVLWYEGTTFLSEDWSPGLPGRAFVSWVEESFRSIAPSTADNAEIKLKLIKPEVSTSGIFYYDDVSMEEVITGTFHISKGPYSPSDHNWFYDPDGDPYNEMIQLNLTAGPEEDVRVETITIEASGTGNDAEDIDVVDLVVDVNNSGSYDDADIFLTNGSYLTDNGTLTLTIQGGRIIPASSTEYWLIAYEMTNTSVYGDTFTFDLIYIDAFGVNSGSPIGPEGLPISACIKTTSKADQTPPISWLIIGDPHYNEGNTNWWVNWETPFALAATDDESTPIHGNDSGPNIDSIWYRIDAGAWIEYTESFNFSSSPLGAHTIAYYSVDKANNTEETHYTEVIVDDTPPELMSGYVEPLNEEEGQVFGYNVTYVDDSGRPIDYFGPSASAAVSLLSDQHPRKAVGYDNNTHFVWMSKRDGQWEIYYKEIDPDGYGRGPEGKVILQNQTIVNDTMISDDNSTDSAYPSIVIEPHEQTYLNDTKYDNRYAILAAPVRYYVDQQQLLENNSVLVNVTPSRWQDFTTSAVWDMYEEGDFWLDVMIYKDPGQTYTNPIRAALSIPGQNPSWSQLIPAAQIIDGNQWLAFYINSTHPLVTDTTYRIEISSKDPYKWYYCSDLNNHPYPQDGSSLDVGNNQNIDFTFVIRYNNGPEMRFKYETEKMRDCLVNFGFTDENITVLTIPYWIKDGLGNNVRWRVPYSDIFPAVIWQPLPYDFSEPWIDGNATHLELWQALNSTRANATEDDLIFIELRDHGGGAGSCGCALGGRRNGHVHGMTDDIPTDPRVNNDEIQDDRDECFYTYASPSEDLVTNSNNWFDDELDIELDKMNYSNMVIEVDTCHAGGFVPDLSGPRRIVVACGREDETTYSYTYKFYERLQDSNADKDQNGFVSIEEAHEYAVHRIPIEQIKIKQHPQMNVYDDIHVVWIDERYPVSEIYYSKLGGVVNYSAANNGVDLYIPDLNISNIDGWSSGRAVFPTVDDGNIKFIEHPDIAIDSRNNISIVWSDMIDDFTHWEIYYQLQDEDANVLIDDINISSADGKDSQNPAVDTSPLNDRVHIVWQDNRTNNWEIFYEKIDPYGGTFTLVDDKRITGNDGFDSALPDVGVDDSGFAHVAFMDKRTKDPGHERDDPNPHKLGYWEIYVATMYPSGNKVAGSEKRQSDMKTYSWQGSYTGNTMGDGFSVYPRVEVSGDLEHGTMYITWHDNRSSDTNWEIFYTEIAACNNPALDVRITNNNSKDMYPDIALNKDLDANIKWQTYRNGKWDIWNADWNKWEAISLEVDGMSHHMFQDDPMDTNSADGIYFVYSTSLEAGEHTYRFSANNGLRDAVGDIYMHTGPNVGNATIPLCWLIIGDPHYNEYNTNWWVNWETSFTLVATDNESIPTYGNESGPHIESILYSIDSGGWIEYTESFNLSGYSPGMHTIAYYCIDDAGNKEETHYTEVIVDDTPPELMSGYVEPPVGEDGQVFGYNVTYFDDTGRSIDYFRPSTGVSASSWSDQHPRKAIGYDNNKHIVWMSNRNGHWEIYYKEIDPDGIGIGLGGKIVIQNQTIVNDTMISDGNNTDSMYPSIVIESHEQTYLNDTKYDNRYAILAAPVRYYIDQQQLLENNSVRVDVPGGQWQEFTAGQIWPIYGQDFCLDVMIYKDPGHIYTKPLNASLIDLMAIGQPVIWSQSIPAPEIIDGKQWLAFYNATRALVPFVRYRIVIDSGDPYEWYYCSDSSKNPYSLEGSKLDPLNSGVPWIDFAFIVRYREPEVWFKYETKKMRDCLVNFGFSDENITVLTIPYWIEDELGNSVRWRVPYGFNASVIWQPLPYDFNEPWIDGNATHSELGQALNSTRVKATENDLIFIELRDHGGGRNADGSSAGGRTNGHVHGNKPTDPRVKNDEIQDNTDECFCTYARPSEDWSTSMNYWFDDELDIELDKMNYSNMVIEVDTCHAGGFIPDLSGPRRIVVACGREDETTYSLTYKFYERLQDPNADEDQDGFISVEEAHEYAVSKINRQHPQMNVYDHIHVVWVDHRDPIWEIYYSKLGGVVDYSAVNNSVDLNIPDLIISDKDNKHSGRAVYPTVDDGSISFIEHPDMAIDSQNNISIVWSDYRNGSHWEIYYQFQDEDANVLIDDTMISSDNGKNSQCPAVDTSSSNDCVYIVWQDYRRGNWEIFFEKIDPYDSNFTLIDDIQITGSDGYDSAMPDIGVDDGGYWAHVVFMDRRAKDRGHEYDVPNPHKSGYWEIYTLKIHPAGVGLWEKRQSDMKDPETTYGNYTGNTTGDGFSVYPRIAVSGDLTHGTVYITWHDNRSGDANWEIYYSEISCGCHNPNLDVRVSNNNAKDMYPDIALNKDLDANIKWQTQRDGNWDIWKANWNKWEAINVWIDGIIHHMFQDDPMDTNSADGICFVYGTSLEAGVHTYRFSANNGLRDAVGDTYEHTGPNVLIATIPGAPTNINAELEGSIYQHINITWTLSIDDGAGENDVTGYDIYYSGSYSSNNRTLYAFLDSVEAGISHYVHENAGEGDQDSYFYYVVAKDGAGHGNESMDQVGKFVRGLSIGKQLISIPLVQSDTNIETVLQTVEWDFAQWYDPTDNTDHWKCYDKFKPSSYNDLIHFNHMMALWVNVTIESNLIVTGVVPESTTIHLYKGWNFVGYSSLTSKTVGNALSDIWENVTQIEGYNEMNAPYYLEILSEDDMMITGYGYWICVTKDCEWAIHN